VGARECGHEKEKKGGGVGDGQHQCASCGAVEGGGVPARGRGRKDWPSGRPDGVGPAIVAGRGLN
jgi:hypothetical protein